MGYDVDYIGHFDLNKQLTDEHAQFIKDFARTRHYLRAWKPEEENGIWWVDPEDKYSPVWNDPEFIESLEEISTHNIGHYDAVSQGVNFYNLDVSVSAEIGVILNALMPGYNKGGSRRYNKGTYCRLGLFADYGCLNINGNSFNEPMIKFPGMVDMGNPAVVMSKFDSFFKSIFFVSMGRMHITVKTEKS